MTPEWPYRVRSCPGGYLICDERERVPYRPLALRTTRCEAEAAVRILALKYFDAMALDRDAKR